MKLLSEAEAIAWIKLSGGHIDPLDDDIASRPNRAHVRIQIPDEATAAVGLAYTLAVTPLRNYEEASFAGSLLLLKRWEVWSETIDRVGELMLAGTRQGAGELHTFSSAPGQSFERHDFYLAYASLCIPMLFQWDAVYVSQGADMQIVVSHHGHLDVTLARREDIASLTTRLRG